MQVADIVDLYPERAQESSMDSSLREEFNMLLCNDGSSPLCLMLLMPSLLVTDHWAMMDSYRLKARHNRDREMSQKQSLPSGHLPSINEIKCLPFCYKVRGIHKLNGILGKEETLGGLWEDFSEQLTFGHLNCGFEHEHVGMAC